MNKSQLEFAAIWAKLIGAQRSERARCVAEQGMRKRHMSIHQMADAIGISRKQVQTLIDFYWVEKGGASAHAPLQASQQGLSHAMSQYEADPEEVEERASELQKQHRYSPEVATRAAKAEIIGHQLRRDGKITRGGELTIKDPRFDPAEVRRIKDKHGTPVTFEEWRRRYSQYATEARAFLAFLRRTKQDLMIDDSIVMQLTTFAEGFNEQANRFDVGVAKAEARS